MVQLTDLNFLLKFIACILNIVVLCLWTIPDKNGIPVRKQWSQYLFYQTNLGYLIILVVFVVLYFLDEPPGGWSNRLFDIIGVILFLVIGIVGLIDQLDHGEALALINAILLIIIGILLLVDLIKSEHFF